MLRLSEADPLTMSTLSEGSVPTSEHARWPEDPFEKLTLPNVWSWLGGRVADAGATGSARAANTAPLEARASRRRGRVRRAMGWGS
jgi:hypothetical protein